MLLQVERCGKEFSRPLAQFIENDFIATAVQLNRPFMLMNAEYLQLGLNRRLRNEWTRLYQNMKARWQTLKEG